MVRSGRINDADVRLVEISEEESGHSDGPIISAKSKSNELLQNVEQS